VSARVLCVFLALLLAAQAQKTDTFFAGTVAEIRDDAIVISRTVRGKMENRTFQLTPDTKVEGRLRARVRVTVRYVAADDGDTATLIVVRASQPVKKK
jgi:hypothetical protein